MDRESANSIEALLEHELRHSFSRIVGVLSNRLGLSCLALAEDAAQEALLTAARTWPHYGVPANPSGWLYRVAHNRALDTVRSAANRKASDAPPEAAIAGLESTYQEAIARFEREIDDDVLLLMFSLCQPLFSIRTQICLTLRFACGFSPAEIGALLFVKKSAVQQQIVRAKRRIQDRRSEVRTPTPNELPPRLDAVLLALYLQFTVGYTAPLGDTLIQHDACREALRLTRILLSKPDLATPSVHALAALFCAHLSRFSARISPEGLPVALDQQDRSRWDRSMILAAVRHLKRAGTGPRLSRYHLEAGIAVEHAVAPDLESTNWELILEYYTMLEERLGGRLLSLNRLVAVSYVQSPGVALKELARLDEAGDIQGDDYRLHALWADLHRRAGNPQQASAAYKRACAGCDKPQIWQWLNQRRAALTV